jgi:hypothetical protein
MHGPGSLTLSPCQVFECRHSVVAQLNTQLYGYQLGVEIFPAKPLFASEVFALLESYP